MRRSRVWKRPPSTRHRGSGDAEAPELGAVERRLLSDELQALVPSRGALESGPPESSPRVEQRLEMLEQRQHELLDVVKDLGGSVLKITEKLDEARYDRELETALRTLAAPDADYQRLVRRIREVALTSLPRDVDVLVVSKGDDDLLDLHGRRAKHFPQDERGGYSGYYPRDGTSAIVHLESLRARGRGFLLFPRTAFWWLDHYVAFRAHLESRYPELLRDDACVIYDLRRPKPADALAQIGAAIQEYKERFDRDPAILDLHTGLEIASALPEQMVFTPPTNGPLLPYLDASIDFVVVLAEDFFAEARRVASGAVVFVRNADEQTRTEW